MAATATPFPSFNWTQARQDGYTDDEILNHLATSKKFDSKKALTDGYSKQELIEHLSGQAALDPSHGTDRKDSIIDFLRPLLSGGAATLAAPSVPFTGGVPVGPVAAYTGIDALLQHLKTKKDNSIASGIAKEQVGGFEEGSPEATLLNTAEQFGVGKLGEAAFNIVGRGAKIALGMGGPKPDLYNLTLTTSQALKVNGYDKLAGASKAVEDMSISVKNKALDRIAGNGFSEALQTAKNAGLNFSRNPNLMLDTIQQDMPSLATGRSVPVNQTFKVVKPIADSFSKLDAVIADPVKLEQTLTAAQQIGTADNLKKSLAGYKFMDIFNKATERKIGQNTFQDNVVRIDPTAVAKEWLDPEMQDSLKLLYNSKQRADITQFFTNLGAVQDKIGSGSYRKLWLMNGGIGLGTGMLLGHSIEGGIGGVAGAYVGAQAFSRILTNPKTARIAVAMAGGEPLGVNEQYAARLMMQALQGETVALINDKGEKVPVRVGKDSFVPLGQPAAPPLSLIPNGR